MNIRIRKQFLAISFGVFTAFVLQGCSIVQNKEIDAKSNEVEVATAFEGGEKFLQVPLKDSVIEREKLREYFEESTNYFHREKFEEVIGLIGANGIIHTIETHKPLCHDDLHDLGKVIYAELGEIGPSLATCADSCYSGCMHGVMMEAFGNIDETKPHDHEEEEVGFHLHVSVEEMKAKIGDLCYDSTITDSYKSGDCMHGVGHAFMAAANYDITLALEYCDVFETEPERYYCATGAYMEYNNNFALQDYEAGKYFYPCNENKYPAACYRYKFGPVFQLHYRNQKSGAEIIDACLAMETQNRLGCMHGVGNAHTGYIVSEKVTLKEVCGFGEKNDQYVCIEGAMERIGRYYPEQAQGICDAVEPGWQKELCQESIERKLYSLEKPFDLYL